MKGVVFTEFLEMVEDRFTPDVTDEIIAACDLECDGAYTAVGTYDHEELLQLVGELSRQTDVPAASLVRAFGQHLFGRFATNYSGFFEGVTEAFVFLQKIESNIHIEVLKLYPEAELPEFDCEQVSDDRLLMTYRSQRPFADLAEGLILGCAEHFGETIEIDREDLPGDNSVRFTLTRR